MAFLTKAAYRLLTIASLLGIAQGIAWLVMSLICVILYLDPNLSPNFPLGEVSYMDLFNYNIYLLYLNKEYDSSSSGVDFIITPTVFTTFMWIYFFSDILWVIVSGLQLYYINKPVPNPLNIFKSWGVVTAFISLLDFLLVILFGVDFDNCKSHVLEESCTNIIIPVLIIAAKGFVLWIVNVSFVYVIYRIIRVIRSGKLLKTKLLTTEGQIPRATIQNAPSRSHLHNPAPRMPPFDNNRNSANLYNQSQAGGYIEPMRYAYSNHPSRSDGHESKNVPTYPLHSTPQQHPAYNRY